MRTGRPPVVRVTVACESCGATLVRRASDASRNKTRRYFCNATCLRAVGCKPRRGEQRTCEQPGCGATFYRGPNDTKVFCSRECHSASQIRAERRTCERCGGAYLVPPSQQWRRAARYCSRLCEGDSRIARPLDRSHNGRCARLNQHGYVFIHEPKHPKAIKGGWISEHRHVVEQRLGRYLRSDEHVHHVNGNKSDNRSENLEVLTPRAHARVTGAERRAWHRSIDHKLARLTALARYWQRIATLKPDPMLYESIRLIEGDLLRRSGAAREVLH